MEIFLVIWIVWTLIGLGTNWGYGWRDDDDDDRGAHQRQCHSQAAPARQAGETQPSTCFRQLAGSRNGRGSRQGGCSVVRRADVAYYPGRSKVLSRAPQTASVPGLARPLLRTVSVRDTKGGHRGTPTQAFGARRPGGQPRPPAAPVGAAVPAAGRRLPARTAS